MAIELTGIMSGTGAKMKAEVAEDHVTFRGAYKADVPFEEIVAEARGTLLVMSFRGQVVEVGAGARASQLASKIRSPPSRLDRMGIEAGISAAVAGPVEPSFKSELSTRAVVVQGAPKEPVDALFFGVEAAAQLGPLPRLAGLVRPGGYLWVVYPKASVTESQVQAGAKAAGLRFETVVRFSGTHSTAKLSRR